MGQELGGIEAKNAGDDLLAAVMDLPDKVDFSTAKELRSRLLSRIDEFQSASVTTRPCCSRTEL